jgi:hypothetical protein
MCENVFALQILLMQVWGFWISTCTLSPSLTKKTGCCLCSYGLFHVPLIGKEEVYYEREQGTLCTEGVVGGQQSSCNDSVADNTSPISPLIPQKALSQQSRLQDSCETGAKSLRALKPQPHSLLPSLPHNSSWKESKLCLFR